MAGTPQERSDYVPTGYQMIHAIEIDNFRCYRRLRISKVARLNVVVGDNGSGKTALLEAIFSAMATTSEVAMRFRQQRGLDSSFNAAPRRVEDAIWGELFHEFNYREPVRIALRGDGPEARSLVISRSMDKDGRTFGDLSLTYKDARGGQRVYPIKVTAKGVPLVETGEDLPDFFHFPANTTTGSVENAGRFSDLSRSRRQENFVRVFADEYEWLEDLNIEVVAGAPALYGTRRGTQEKIALPNISGGINRMVAILVAIASRQRAIVLADEIENGVYYKHQSAIWRGLLKFLRERDGQMICTTHSREWLEALVQAAEGNVDDIALWRIERGKDGPEVRQFSGDTLQAGIEHGAEVRSND